MSNKITDKETSTTTPTHWIATIGGGIKQYTSAAFSALIGALIGPQSAAAAGKETPADADKLPLSDSAASDATKHLTWAHLKAALQGLLTPAAHTHAQSAVTDLVTDLADKAPLASPALTGVPTAPTAAPATNTTQVATTAYADAAAAAAAAALVAAAPGVLDTLNELAAALGDDANFAATVASQLSDKADYELSNVSAATARSNLGLSSGATMGVATQAQAQAGEVNTYIMTPLRTVEAMATQIMLPFRLVAASGDLVVGNYDLITLPRGFRLDSFCVSFDGPAFESPVTAFEFSLAHIGSGETIPVLSSAAILTTQTHSVSFTPVSITQDKLLRLSVTAFDGVGYAGGTAKGGVVWMGGRWL